MRMTFWSCVLALVVGGAAAAQDKPDFSGQWVLVGPNESVLNIAQELAVRQSIEVPFTILTVEQRFKSEMRSQSYKIGIIGGTVSVDRSGSGSGSRTHFSVTWDGDRLVIETGSHSGPTPESGRYTEHKEVWSLDVRDRLVMAVTDRGSGAEPTTTTLTYQRR